MVIAPRQLKCAALPQAAAEMPQPPTAQAWLAAHNVTFLAGPGVKKNLSEQEVPRCSPVTSRWKVGLLLGKWFGQTCRVQGCFPLSNQNRVQAVPYNPDSSFQSRVPLFQRALALDLWKLCPQCLQA